MKKHLCILVAVLLMMTLTALCSDSQAAAGYVSIKELRETLPQRWTGEYVVEKGAYKQLEKGDTVSVDVPIVVPEVDAVPVVRIMWEPPAEGLDESVSISLNGWGIKGMSRDFSTENLRFPLLERKVTFDPALPWEDAPTIAIEEIQKWLPFMRDKELTCYFQQSYGESEDKGFQCLYFYTTYHGIPQLKGGSIFLHGLESEYGSHSKEKMAVPASMVAIRIERPGSFWANIYTSQEIGVDMEDIPLLPFEEILNVLQQQVVDGYAYMLNEVCFGYMPFIDPEKKGEEFLLLPVWAAKGRTRTDLNLPFDLETDQVVVDQGGYGSRGVIVVNAQTGEVYDFVNDRRPDRLYVPHIITWDEVN